MKCVECKYFDQDKKSCGINEDVSPIRKCVFAINKEIVLFLRQLPKRKHKYKLLNIGCGSWCYVKDNLPDHVEWHGIDVEKFDKKGNETIATKVGSVQEIPFDDDFFDFVISDQSMEHWYEYGVSLNSGLNEINRVLKKGGHLMINVPIYLHGNKCFVRGETEKIKNIFENNFWEMTKFREWRKDFAPLKPYFGWKDRFYEKIMRGKSTYVLEIVARKKERSKLNFGNLIKSKTSKLILLFPHKIRQNIILFFNVSIFDQLAYFFSKVKQRIT